MELVRLLNKTPREIGQLRHSDPAGISFLEQKIIWEYQEREKHEKKMAQKAKSHKSGKKR